MKDDQNFKWTMKDLAHQYKIENQNWTWKECWKKANVVHKELKRLNKEMWDGNKKYFEHNTPFSFFESEDGELSSIPELDGI